MENEVLNFYSEVLNREASGVDSINVKNDIERIRKAYQKTSKMRRTVLVDYGEVGKRYAYIYRFATCHTMAVTCFLTDVMEKSPSIFANMMKYHDKILNVCSLGGGPGSDLVGFLRARAKVGIGFTKKIRCSVVDISRGWEKSLKTVLDVYLKSSIGNVYKGKLQFKLLWSNLQQCISLPAIIRIANADVLNLVKFVSALSSDNIFLILKNVFNILKPGAFVFFLDNSIGGFYEIVHGAARESGLLLAVPVVHRCKISMKTLSIGPLRLGMKPLSSTSVCFTVWRKPNEV